VHREREDRLESSNRRTRARRSRNGGNAGSVDIHSHLASSSCNHARPLIPDGTPPTPRGTGSRRGRGARFARETGGTVPSHLDHRYRYAGLGYTLHSTRRWPRSCPPLSHRRRRHAVCGMAVSTSSWARNELSLRQIETGSRSAPGIRRLAASLDGRLRLSDRESRRGRGVEGRPAQRTRLDESIGGRKVTLVPCWRRSRAPQMPLHLPHPVHIHCNNLGIPGTSARLRSMQALSGQRAHFTHLQFHCYGRRAWARGGNRRLAGDRVRQCAPRSEHGCGAGDVWNRP